MEYTLLEFIIVVIIILTHGIAYYTVFIHAAPMEKKSTILSHVIFMQFHTNNIWHHNI